MSFAQPADTGSAANSLPRIQALAAHGRLTWAGPLTVIAGRSALILLAQALVAAVFYLRGNSSPWLAAAPWWTVYGTIVDIGCLALMWRFTRREGLTLRDLIGSIRLRFGRDLFHGLGVFLLVFPLFVIGGMLATWWLYGSMHAEPFPGILSRRVLPLWAILYSRGLWWLIWSPTEEMTYNAYALPRIQALSGRAWVAVAVVGFWWAIQHSFLPFIPDWRTFIARFLIFVPGVIGMQLVYLKTRRLAPLILAHWMMDLASTFMTIQG